VAAMFVTVCNKEIDSLEYNVGHLYSQNFNFLYNNSFCTFTENPSVKRAWYEQAANKGNPMGLYELGVFYENTNEETKAQNLAKATGYFQKAYTAGSIAATYKLASMYLHGHGVSQDLRKGLTLLNEAADMGHKDSHKILNGLNVDDEEDKHETIRRMLEIASESGHVISQYNLGILTSDTKSSYYNIKEAIKWLETA
jgi:TPR repeat protein